MRYAEIDFQSIYVAREAILGLYDIHDYTMFMRAYMEVDPLISTCLQRHRVLHSDLKRMDFVRLSPIDFSNRVYIYNRLKKMNRGVQLLVKLDKSH